MTYIYVIRSQWVESTCNHSYEDMEQQYLRNDIRVPLDISLVILVKRGPKISKSACSLSL